MTSRRSESVGKLRTFHFVPEGLNGFSVCSECTFHLNFYAVHTLYLVLKLVKWLHLSHVCLFCKEQFFILFLE